MEVKLDIFRGFDGFLVLLILCGVLMGFLVFLLGHTVFGGAQYNSLNKVYESCRTVGSYYFEEGKGIKCEVTNK